MLEYFNRSLYTLQELTRLLQIQFHYDRLFKRYETSYQVSTVLTLMTRARKMYQAIDQIATVIKLLEKLSEVQGSGNRKNKNGEFKEEYLRRVANLRARIRCAIKAFVTQHTLFPVQFKFGGEDKLAKFKKKSAEEEKFIPQNQKDEKIIDLRLGTGQTTEKLA